MTFPLTQHHQRDLARVDPRRLLDLALVRGRVGGQQGGDLDGGVAIAGNPHEVEPLHQVRGPQPVLLPSRVGEELAEETQLEQNRTG